MTAWWILFAVLVIMAAGFMPSWPYSREWGYYPAGMLWLLVVVLLILILAGAFERS